MLKSKKTLKKTDESKLCQSWVSGMCDPNKNIDLHLCENFYSQTLENGLLRIKKLIFGNFLFIFWQKSTDLGKYSNPYKKREEDSANVS